MAFSGGPFNHFVLQSLAGSVTACEASPTPTAS